MTWVDILLYFSAAFAGSAINAVAGGGTFLTFPLLIFNGLTSIQANVMSTIALWPGSVMSALTYRGQLAADRRTFLPFAAVSILGSALGTFILLATPETTFDGLVPWLLLFATLVFVFGNRGIALIRPFAKGSAASHRTFGLALQFAIAVYGGYFGAGIGILMLAMLQVMGMSHIHEMNAMKTILGSAINAVAFIVFAAVGPVSWAIAAIMIPGAIAGGYAGAALALKVPPQKARALAGILAVSMTAYFFFTKM
jgi:uncharacterized protein